MSKPKTRKTTRAPKELTASDVAAAIVTTGATMFTSAFNSTMKTLGDVLVAAGRKR